MEECDGRVLKKYLGGDGQFINQLVFS